MALPVITRRRGAPRGDRPRTAARLGSRCRQRRGRARARRRAAQTLRIPGTAQSESRGPSMVGRRQCVPLRPTPRACNAADAPAPRSEARPSASQRIARPQITLPSSASARRSPSASASSSTQPDTRLSLLRTARKSSTPQSANARSTSTFPASKDRLPTVQVKPPPPGAAAPGRDPPAPDAYDGRAAVAAAGGGGGARGGGGGGGGGGGSSTTSSSAQLRLVGCGMCVFSRVTHNGAQWWKTDSPLTL